MVARHGTPEQRDGVAARDRRPAATLLLRVHRAGGGLEREQPAHDRHADGRRVGASRGPKTYISALESCERMIVVARDAGERRPHGARAADPVRGRDGDAGDGRCARLRAPVERVLRRRDRGRRRRSRRARPRVGRVLFDGLNPERLVVASQAVGRRPLLPRAGHGLRARAGRVRRADRRAPGDPASTRRGARRARGRVGARRGGGAPVGTTRASRWASARASPSSPPATPACSPPTARCRPSAAAVHRRDETAAAVRLHAAARVGAGHPRARAQPHRDGGLGLPRSY